MLYLTKLNNSYWIRPDGAEFPFDVLGEHSEEASKYVKSGECNEDPQICLLKEGWIAQRENSFLVWNLTRNEKEIIWERSKRFSFDKIFIDSFMGTGKSHNVLADQPVEMLWEQIDEKYRVSGTEDCSCHWWIEPSGVAHHILDRREDFANKMGESPYDLMRRGWIRQRANNFEAIGPLTIKQKDIMLMCAKDLDYDTITLDVFDRNVNFIWSQQLIDEPIEKLYEFFSPKNSSNYYETDTEEVYEFALKRDADAFELDLIMSNGIYPRTEEDTVGDHSKNKVYRVIIDKEINKRKLEEQKKKLPALAYDYDSDCSFIDPNGDEHLVGFERHQEFAKEIEKDVDNPILELLKKGWIRRCANSFEVFVRPTMSQKDIIFMIAKKNKYEKIFVDSWDGNDNSKLIISNEPPEALYESRFIFAKSYWISPSGEVINSSEDEHNVVAKKIVGKRYQKEFNNLNNVNATLSDYEDFLTDRGWVTERNCNFYCSELTQRVRDNIFIFAKENGCEKITVETQRKTELLDKPIDMLYEQKKKKWPIHRYEVYEIIGKIIETPLSEEDGRTPYEAIGNALGALKYHIVTMKLKGDDLIALIREKETGKERVIVARKL